MKLFLKILAAAFAIFGIVAVAGAKSIMQELAAILCFGFAGLIVSALAIMNTMQDIARRFERGQEPVKPPLLPRKEYPE